ncbi:HTH-type transcriptional regulator CynR [Paraburkholderia kirstenboschensis]|uniref:LysR family transcriptional regulator n=1 Tax=Paraburkholderia kirstenboschensis TaxID=1245436 RepID=UPI000ADE8255|nr:LysR family transcriptional regulator [Paraburkholderia kirstenboschensis]CAD6560934.1 HTH-type transcriptional regulator CynR [Paraburkholderia kirstenboschensis]
MDLKQLEHFVAVAEERHFTRAARRLNLVQSGLSASIRLLEDELGGPLFIRSTRRVDFTPAGEVLFAQARRVLAAARDARHAVTQVHGLARGRLSIGSIHGLAPFVDLPATLGRFRAAFGGIDIHLTLDGSRALIDEVREGRLDLAFTQPSDSPPDDLGSQMFACEGMVVVCATHHRLAGANGLKLADLCEETFADLRPEWSVRRLVDRSFAAAGLQRQISFEVNDMPMLLELAAQGLAITIVPASVASARVRDTRGAPVATATLREAEEPCWELAAVFKGSAAEPLVPVARAFLDLLILPAVAT